MKAILSSLLPVVSLAASTVCLEAVTKPNIIYILADDMGQGDVRAYNKDCKFPTPNIDRIASEGVKFMDAHTSSGVCTPTRYGILTGRYSWRTEMKQGVLGGYSPHLIDPNRMTVPSLLKEQGYATACIGKWHLGMDWKADKKKSKGKRISWKHVDPKAPISNGPVDVGFDYYFGISASLNMSPHAYIENRRMLGTVQELKNLKEVEARGFIQPAQPGFASEEFVQQEVLSDMAEKTCSWIRKQGDKPFFVYLPLPSPHSPIVPSERFQGKSGLNDHGDFCMESDWLVGEVLATLDELEIADNTIVIFTADNGTSPKAGFPTMEKKGHHSSWIYRGMKGTNWEGGHRVPFVVRWPDGVKAGTVSDQLTCTTDMLATTAELVGVKLPDNAGEDSLSFLPILKGGEVPKGDQRVVVHHSDKGIFSVRRGKWKLMFDDSGGSNRGDPRKTDPIVNRSSLLLFNMETDAIERTNVAAEHPEVVESLKKGLATIIMKGRSTPGADQPSDHASAKWPQLKVVEEYLK